jgi:hypothetical protein
MKRLSLLIATIVICPNCGYITDAEARSRCTYYTDGREPRCLTTSDTGKEQYKDDRASDVRRRMMQRRMAIGAQQARGRADWRNNGTPSSVGTISPFVPGSVEDTAWRAERKRRGIQ